MSYNYEKALSLDWNGQVFILTVRNEIPAGISNYLYSYDGLNWSVGTDISYSPVLTTKNPYNIKWTGTNYAMIGNIATSSGNTLLTSYNGINYSPIPSNLNIPLYDIEANLEFPHTITFPRNMTLALGGISSDSTKIAYSVDEGITWTPAANSPFSTTANNAVWNGKMWVAVGSGGNTIATSSDGNTWVGRGSYIFTSTGSAIAWSRDQALWVAGGSGTNSLAYSSDSVYWYGIGNSILSAVNDVQWNGNIWVAAGNPISGNKSLAYSYDGKSWSTPTQTNLFDGSGVKLTWNGSFWTALGYSSSANSSYNMATSTNGINWSMSVNPNFAPPSAPTGLSGTSSTSSTISISFTAPAAAVTSYTVTAIPTSGSTVTQSFTGTTYTITGLQSAITYTISVTATNIYGTSASSSTATYTTILSPPTALSATSSTSTTISISFTPPSGTVTSYTVTAVPTSGGTVTQSFSAPATTYTITGLQTAMGYTISLTATNTNGTSTSSTSISYYTGTLYSYYSIAASTGGTWGSGDQAFAASYSGQYMYGVASYSNINSFNYSSNYGSSWTTITIGSTFYTKAICCSWDGSMVYAIGLNSTTGNIYKSTNYGASFTQLTSANFVSTDQFWGGACSSDGKYVYICCQTTNSFYYSSDYGATWTKTTNIISSNVKCSPDGKYVICSSGSATTFATLSSNYGVTWSNLSIYTNYSNCAISQNGTYILLYNTTAGFWTLSTNGGTTFTSIPTLYYGNQSNPREGCSMSYTGQYMFITYGNGTILSGLAYSMDYGTTWQLVPQSTSYVNSNATSLGLYTKPIAIAPSGNYLIGRYGGINSTFVLTLTSRIISVNTSSPFNSVISSTSLVMAYTFSSTTVNGISLANLASGTAVYDASLSNAASVSSAYAKYGDKSLQANGSYYVTLPTFTITPANGYCMSCWLLYTGSPSGTIFCYKPGLWHMYYDTTNTLQTYENFNWAGNGAYMNTIANGSWHHIVFNATYVSSTLTIFRHYYDGRLILEFNETSTYSATYLLNTNFLNYRNDGGYFHNNGYTDCFRFYNRTLTLDEIQTLYNAGM